MPTCTPDEISGAVEDHDLAQLVHDVYGSVGADGDRVRLSGRHRPREGQLERPVTKVGGAGHDLTRSRRSA